MCKVVKVDNDREGDGCEFMNIFVRAEDGRQDLVLSRGVRDVYKELLYMCVGVGVCVCQASCVSLSCVPSLYVCVCVCVCACPDSCVSRSCEPSLYVCACGCVWCLIYTSSLASD